VTTHRLDLVAPSLDIPRMHPCQAQGIGPGSVLCGATPASLWRKECGTPSHGQDAWLCGNHASLIARGMGTCRACGDRGATARVTLAPVDLLLLGHAGKGG